MKTLEEIPLTKIDISPGGYEARWDTGLKMVQLVDTDKGPYTCLALLSSVPEGRFHLLGGKENDFNTILFSGADKRVALKYYHHLASKYLHKPWDQS